MPDNRIVETGAGFIPLAIVKPDENGKLSDRAVLTLAAQQEVISRAINGQLSFGTGEQSSRAGNFDAQFRTVRFTTADEQVRIPHALGRPPIGFLVTLPDRACNIYAMNLGGWGGTDFYLASDVSGALVQLIVF